MLGLPYDCGELLCPDKLLGVELCLDIGESTTHVEVH